MSVYAVEMSDQHYRKEAEQMIDDGRWNCYGGAEEEPKKEMVEPLLQPEYIILDDDDELD
jgi:hypothetical protein